MGPATEDGFYFDFDLAEKISEADFPKIEKEIQKLIKADLPMKQEFLTLAQAKVMFKDNPYKLDWLDRITNRGEKISIYRTGEADVDLCKSPPVKPTGQLKAFQLL